MEDHSQPHVLVVDDDLIIRGVARESLTEAGFLVSEAENGVRALQALENLRPDIILLDVMMPEMDGFATAGAVRHLPGCEMIPILIMTALDDLDSINRAYEVGATDFITKPINWVILVQRVRYMTRAVRMMKEQKRLEEELQQAQKLEAVATLAGGVAHDFNNLLQGIQGSSEVLLFGKKKDDPIFPVLNRIMAAVKRGGEFTRQLLTYSRKVKSEKRPIQLNDQVRQTHQLLQRTIPKMIEIELRLEKDLKMVNAEWVQMEQVLMNLAINASIQKTLKGSLSSITSLAFSRTGSQLAAGAADGSLYLFDIETQASQIFPGQTARIHSLIFHRMVKYWFQAPKISPSDSGNPPTVRCGKPSKWDPNH